MLKKITLILILFFMFIISTGFFWGQSWTMTIGEDVNDFEIINEKSSFESGETIFFLIESNQKFDTDMFKVILYQEAEKGGFSIVDSQNFQVDSNWNKVYNSIQYYLSNGEYKLQIKVNNETSLDENFRIE